VKTSGRVPFIGGNWKMYGTRSSVSALVKGLNEGHWHVSGLQTVVAPASIHIDYVLSNINKSIQVSAQNSASSAKLDGAFTGEISAGQIKDFGLNWVILGHSERRKLYQESCQVVAEKIVSALKAGLSVIACLGETEQERKSDQTIAVVERQLKSIADSIVASGVSDAWSRVVLAYEPVWAIGTGLVASPQQAQEVHAAMRSWLGRNYGTGVSSTTRIIYGGSVKPDNCDALMALQDVDGFLVGGASLVATDFLRILNSVKPSSTSSSAPLSSPAPSPSS